ncbi:hypothetical protein Tco_1491288 [Tanacetum coccineum]
MYTYPKHMARYKQNQLKSKNYDEIQKLFDKAMIRLEFDNSKKQKIDENIEAKVDDEAEMKKHMEIVSDDEGRNGWDSKRLHDDLEVNTAKVRVTAAKHNLVLMTKVIKGEFEKIKDVKVEDVSLTCDTPLEVFNNEHEADNNMGYDPSDVAFTEWIFLDQRRLYKVSSQIKESSDDMDEVAKVFRIDTNLFDFETPMCKIYEWNKDVPWVDEKPWTNVGVWTKPTPVKHTFKPFNYKTGCSEWPTCSWKNDRYCHGGNLLGTYIIGNQLHYQDYEWYKALEDSELKDEALRNKAIMEGFIDDDDESRYKQKRQWNIYTNTMMLMR